MMSCKKIIATLAVCSGLSLAIGNPLEAQQREPNRYNEFLESLSKGSEKAHADKVFQQRLETWLLPSAIVIGSVIVGFALARRASRVP